MLTRRSKRVLITGAITAALTLTTAGAVVAAPNPFPFFHRDGRIHACVLPDGEIRILRPEHHCDIDEYPLSWDRNAREFIGHDGRNGRDGHDGRNGRDGRDGRDFPRLNPTPLQSVQTPTPPPTQPVTSQTFTALPGLSLTLEPGTYLINADLRGVIVSTGACGLVARLAAGTPPTAIPDSARLIFFSAAAATNTQTTASINQIFTVTGPGPTVVQVQAAQSTGSTNCSAGTGIATDVNGSSVINAVRIN